MELSEMGKIVEKCCLEIPAHYLNVVLDEYIVMPNHMHGIIVINNPLKWELDPENPYVENRMIAQQ